MSSRHQAGKKERGTANPDNARSPNPNAAIYRLSQDKTAGKDVPKSQTTKGSSTPTKSSKVRRKDNTTQAIPPPSWYNANSTQKCEMEIVPNYPQGYNTYYDYSRNWKMWDLICSNSVNNVHSFINWSLRPVYICTYSRDRHHKLIFKGKYIINNYGNQRYYTGNSIRYFMYGCSDMACPLPPSGEDKICDIEWLDGNQKKIDMNPPITPKHNFEYNTVPSGKQFKAFRVKCKMDYIQMCLYKTDDDTEPTVIRNKKHFMKVIDVSSYGTFTKYAFMCTEFQEYVFCPPHNKPKDTCIIAELKSTTAKDYEIFSDNNGYKYINHNQVTGTFVSLVNRHVSVCLYTSKTDKFPFYLALDTFGKPRSILPEYTGIPFKYIKYQCKHIERCEPGIVEDECVVNLKGHTNISNYNNNNYTGTNLAPPPRQINRDAMIKINTPVNDFFTKITSLTKLRLNVCLYNSLYQKVTSRPYTFTSNLESVNLPTQYLEYMYFWCGGDGECPEVECHNQCCVLEQYWEFGNRGNSYFYHEQSQNNSYITVPSQYSHYLNFRISRGVDKFAMLCAYDSRCLLSNKFRFGSGGSVRITQSRVIHRIKYKCGSAEYTIDDLNVFCPQQIDGCPPASSCELDLKKTSGGIITNKILQLPWNITKLEYPWSKSFTSIQNLSNMLMMSVCFYDDKGAILQDPIRLNALQTTKDTYKSIFKKATDYLFTCDSHWFNCPPKQEECKIRAFETVQTQTTVFQDYYSYYTMIPFTGSKYRSFMAYNRELRLCIYYEDNTHEIITIKKNAIFTITNTLTIRSINYVCEGVTIRREQHQQGQGSQTQTQTGGQVTYVDEVLTGQYWINYRCDQPEYEDCRVKLKDVYSPGLNPNFIELKQNTNLSMGQIGLHYSLKYLSGYESHSRNTNTLCLYYKDSNGQYKSDKIDIKSRAVVENIHKTTHSYDLFSFTCYEKQACFSSPPSDLCILELNYDNTKKYYLDSFSTSPPPTQYTNAHGEIHQYEKHAFMWGNRKVYEVDEDDRHASKFKIHLSNSFTNKMYVCVYSNIYDQNPFKRDLVPGEFVLVPENKKTSYYFYTTCQPSAPCYKPPQPEGLCTFDYYLLNGNKRSNNSIQMTGTINISGILTKIENQYEDMLLICVYRSQYDIEAKKLIFSRKNEIHDEINKLSSSSYSISFQCLGKWNQQRWQHYMNAYVCPPPEPRPECLHPFKVEQYSPYIDTQYNRHIYDSYSYSAYQVNYGLSQSGAFKNHEDYFVAICVYTCNDSNPQKLLLKPKETVYASNKLPIFNLIFFCLGSTLNESNTKFNGITCPAVNTPCNQGGCILNTIIHNNGSPRNLPPWDQQYHTYTHVNFDRNTTYKSFYGWHMQVCLYTSSTDRFGTLLTIPQNAPIVNPYYPNNFTEFKFKCDYPSQYNGYGGITQFNCERHIRPPGECELYQGSNINNTNRIFNFQSIYYHISTNSQQNMFWSKSRVTICFISETGYNRVSKTLSANNPFNLDQLQDSKYTNLYFVCNDNNPGGMDYIRQNCRSTTPPDNCDEINGCGVIFHSMSTGNYQPKKFQAESYSAPQSIGTLDLNTYGIVQSQGQMVTIVCLYTSENSAATKLVLTNCLEQRFIQYTGFKFMALFCGDFYSAYTKVCPIIPYPVCCRDEQKNQIRIRLESSNNTSNQVYSLPNNYSTNGLNYVHDPLRSSNKITNLSNYDISLCVWEKSCGAPAVRVLQKNADLFFTSIYAFFFDCNCPDLRTISQIQYRCSQFKQIPLPPCEDCCELNLRLNNDQEKIITDKHLQPVNNPVAPNHRGFYYMGANTTSVHIRSVLRDVYVCFYKTLYDQNPFGIILTPQTGWYAQSSYQYINYNCDGCGGRSQVRECITIPLPPCSITQMDPFWNVNYLNTRTYSTNESNKIIRVEPNYWYSYYFRNNYESEVTVCVYNSQCHKPTPLVIPVNGTVSASLNNRIQFIQFYCLRIESCPTIYQGPEPCHPDPPECKVDIRYSSANETLRYITHYYNKQNITSIKSYSSRVMACLYYNYYDSNPLRIELGSNTTQYTNNQNSWKYNYIYFFCPDSYYSNISAYVCPRYNPPPNPPVPVVYPTCEIIASFNGNHPFKNYTTPYTWFYYMHYTISDSHISYNQFYNNKEYAVKLCLYSYAQSQGDNCVEELIVGANSTGYSKKTEYRQMIMFCKYNSQMASSNTNYMKCPDNCRPPPPPPDACRIESYKGQGQTTPTILEYKEFNDNNWPNNLRDVDHEVYRFENISSTFTMFMCFYTSSTTVKQYPNAISIQSGQSIYLQNIPRYTSYRKWYFVCATSQHYACKPIEPPIPVPCEPHCGDCRIDHIWGSSHFAYTTSRIFIQVTQFYNTARTFYNYANVTSVICLYPRCHGSGSVAGVHHIIASRSSITIAYSSWISHIWYDCFGNSGSSTTQNGGSQTNIVGDQTAVQNQTYACPAYDCPNPYPPYDYDCEVIFKNNNNIVLTDSYSTSGYSFFSKRNFTNSYNKITVKTGANTYMVNVCLYNDDPIPYQTYLHYGQSIDVSSRGGKPYKYYTFICSSYERCPIIDPPTLPCWIIQGDSSQSTNVQIPNGVHYNYELNNHSYLWYSQFRFNTIPNQYRGWRHFKNSSTSTITICMYTCDNRRGTKTEIPAGQSKQINGEFEFMFYYCGSTVITTNNGCPYLPVDHTSNCGGHCEININQGSQVFVGREDWKKHQLNGSIVNTIGSSYKHATACLYRNEYDPTPKMVHIPFDNTVNMQTNSSSSTYSILRFICNFHYYGECPKYCDSHPCHKCDLMQLGSTDSHSITYSQNYSNIYIQTGQYQWRRFRNISKIKYMRACIYSSYDDQNPESIDIQPSDEMTSTRNIIHHVWYACASRLLELPACPIIYPPPICPFPPCVEDICKVHGFSTTVKIFGSDGVNNIFQYINIPPGTGNFSYLYNFASYTRMCLCTKNSEGKTMQYTGYNESSKQRWSPVISQGYTPYKYAFICNNYINIVCPPCESDIPKCELIQEGVWSQNAGSQLQNIHYKKYYTNPTEWMPNRNTWDTIGPIIQPVPLDYQNAWKFTNPGNTKMYVCLYNNLIPKGNTNVYRFELNPKQSKNGRAPLFNNITHIAYTCGNLSCPDITPPNKYNGVCKFDFSGDNQVLKVPGFTQENNIDVIKFQPFPNDYKFTDTTFANTTLKSVVFYAKSLSGQICLYTNRDDRSPKVITYYEKSGFTSITIIKKYKYFAYRCYESIQSMNTYMSSQQYNGSFQGCPVIRRVCETDNWSLIQGKDDAFNLETTYSHISSSQWPNFIGVTSVYHNYQYFKLSGSYNVSLCVFESEHDRDPELLQFTNKATKISTKTKIKFIKMICGLNINEQHCVNQNPYCELRVHHSGNPYFKFTTPSTTLRREDLIPINNSNDVKITKLKNLFSYMWVCLYTGDYDQEPISVFMNWRNSQMFLDNNTPKYKKLFFGCTSRITRCPVFYNNDFCKLAYHKEGDNTEVAVNGYPNYWLNSIAEAYRDYSYYKNVSSHSIMMKVCVFDQNMNLIREKKNINVNDSLKLTKKEKGYYYLYECIQPNQKYKFNCEDKKERCIISYATIFPTSSTGYTYTPIHKFEVPSTTMETNKGNKPIPNGPTKITLVKNEGEKPVRVCLYRNKYDPYPLETVIRNIGGAASIYQYRIMNEFAFVRFSCDWKYIYGNELITKRWCVGYSPPPDTCKVTQTRAYNHYFEYTHQNYQYFIQPANQKVKNFQNPSNTVAYVCLNRQINGSVLYEPLKISARGSAYMTQEYADSLVFYCGNYKNWGGYSWLHRYWENYNEDMTKITSGTTRISGIYCPEPGPPEDTDNCLIRFYQNYAVNSILTQDFFGIVLTYQSQFENLPIIPISSQFKNNLKMIESFSSIEIVICIYKSANPNDQERDHRPYILGRINSTGGQDNKKVDDIFTHYGGKIHSYVIGCNPHLYRNLRCPKPSNPNKCEMEQSIDGYSKRYQYQISRGQTNIPITQVNPSQLKPVDDRFRGKHNSLFRNMSYSHMDICLYTSKDGTQNYKKISLSAYADEKNQQDTGLETISWIYFNCGTITDCMIPKDDDCCKIDVFKQGRDEKYSVNDYHNFRWIDVGAITHVPTDHTMQINKIVNNSFGQLTVCLYDKNRNRDIYHTGSKGTIDGFGDKLILKIAYICAEINQCPPPPHIPVPPKDQCRLNFITREWEHVVMEKKYIYTSSYRIYRLLHCVGEYEINEFINVNRVAYMHVCLYRTVSDTNPLYIRDFNSSERSPEIYQSRFKEFEFMSFYCAPTKIANECPIFSTGLLTNNNNNNLNAFMQLNEKKLDNHAVDNDEEYEEGHGHDDM